MKRKDFNKEINDLSDTDLREKARALAEELMKLRFRKAAGQLQQTHRLTEIRKNLARVQTALMKKTTAAIPAA